MPTLVECPAQEKLHLLMLGVLPAAETERLAAHLEACATCTAQARQLQSQDTLVEALHDARTIMAELPQDDAVRSLIERLRALPASGGAAADTGVDNVPTDTPRVDAGGAAGSDRELFDFLAPPQSPDELGRLGPYRVLKLLGAGGMGVVFLAEDPHLSRQVALKAMKPVLAASESAKKRFLREARAAAGIENDHIVTIHQVGEDRGVPFLAMQLLRGESLEARLRREGRLPLPEVLRIARETAAGLAAAHDRNLVHRDIKPDNIWLESRQPQAAAPLSPPSEGGARGGVSPSPLAGEARRASSSPS
ncbi:MAG: protein kinase, partial [Planctomycetia bacterium]|nr:protein kinase [Planctomycetia bacterium]